MRSVTFKSVLRGIAARVGDLVEEILEDDARIWFEYIDDRLRQAWEEYMWPEILITEKRYFREGLWVASTYANQAIVFYEPENRYYVNDSGADTIDEPTVGVAWNEIDDFRQYIPYEQLNQTKIDKARAGYYEDPYQPESINAPRSPIKAINGGILAQDPNSDGFIYLEYRERVLDLSGMFIYDSDTVYEADDVIYYDPDIYVANQTTVAGDTPESEPTKFDIFKFPYALKPFVVRAAYSDYLLSEDEETRSNRELNRAISSLDDEVGKYAIQTGQVESYGVRTEHG